jgi:hypothetical protein
VRIKPPSNAHLLMAPCLMGLQKYGGTRHLLSCVWQ